MGHLKKKKSKIFQKFGQNFVPSKPSKSKDTAVLSWGIFQQKKIVAKGFKILIKTLTPINSLNQKIEPFQVGAFKKKVSKKFLKFCQNFDPSKPSKSKDAAVSEVETRPQNPLNQKIEPFQVVALKKKCRQCFKNLVKILTPLNPLNQKIQLF